MVTAIRRGGLVSAALALFLGAGAAPVGAGPGSGGRAPDLGECQELAVGAGHRVSFQALGLGVQIYRWTGTSWAFVGPEAVLFDGNGVVGTHYAGPTWESNSGSTVVAAVSERCTPDPDAIPWLKLDKVTSDGPGIFADVTHIQRLYTVGGLAPAAAGAFVGQEARVPYAADYVFYRKQ